MGGGGSGSGLELVWKTMMRIWDVSRRSRSLCIWQLEGSGWDKFTGRNGDVLLDWVGGSGLFLWDTSGAGGAAVASSEVGAESGGVEGGSGGGR